MGGSKGRKKDIDMGQRFMFLVTFYFRQQVLHSPASSELHFDASNC